MGLGGTSAGVAAAGQPFTVRQFLRMYTYKTGNFTKMPFQSKQPENA